MLARSILAATVVTVCAVSAQSAPVELAVNGGFESGDFSGWTLFPSVPGSITLTSPGSMSAFAACINNTAPASASLIKNANIGVGTVVPGETITISFEARGSTAVGGVAFAEFFSEIRGGGTSSSVILGNAPLALDPDPNVWKPFRFTTAAGTDVSGGVTLQLAAITGAASGGVSDICFDDVSVTVARPTVPASYTSIGAGCAGIAGTPALVATTLPWFGTAFQVDLQNLPPNAPAFLLIGISNAQWGSLTLPFDLGAIGMPGCTLYSSGEVSVATIANGGTAAFSVGITAPGLIDVTFYSQGIALDSTANATGIVVSDAARGVIGLR